MTKYNDDELREQFIEMMDVIMLSYANMRKFLPGYQGLDAAERRAQDIASVTDPVRYKEMMRTQGIGDHMAAVRAAMQFIRTIEGVVMAVKQKKQQKGAAQ